MAVNLGEVYAEARMRTDRLHQDIGEAEGKVSRFSGGMASTLKAGALVAGSAFAALGAGFMVAVNDLGELDRLTKQVEAGITSTGGAAGVTAQQVVDLSSSLEGMSSITQESILQGQNLLLTFTNIQNQTGEGNDIFNQASLAMTNMAAKMGVDASTSAMQLGKALNDPVAGIGALRKAGVQLSDEQTEQVKNFVAMGDTLSAQKIILGELNKEFGGAAEALGNSIPGALALAKDAFGDFLRDGVSPIGGAIKDISLGFIDMLKGLDSSALQGAFSGIAGVINSLLPIIGTIGEALMSIVAKVGPILSSALERLAPLFDRILNAILPLLDPLMAIGEILIDAILSVVEALTPVVEALAPIVQKILEFVAEALGKMAPVLAEIAGQLADIVARILAKMEPYIEQLLDLAMQIIEAVLPVLPEVLDALMPILEILLDLIDPLMKIIVKVEELYTLMMVTVFEAIGWLVDKLGWLISWLAEWGGKIWDFFKALWNTVVSIFHAIIDPFVEVLQGIWNGVKDTFTNVWGAIKGAAETVWNAIKDAIWSPIETVWGMLESAWNTIAGTLEGIWTGIKNTAASIWNGLIDAIKGGINVAITGINTLIDGANAALNAADAAAGPWVNFEKIPHIPYLHTGSGQFPGLGEQLAVVLGGEMVMNRQAVAANRDSLVAMNQGRAVGGSSYDFRGSVFNLPGVSNGADFLDEVTREAERRSVVLGAC